MRIGPRWRLFAAGVALLLPAWAAAGPPADDLLLQELALRHYMEHGDIHHPGGEPQLFCVSIGTVMEDHPFGPMHPLSNPPAELIERLSDHPVPVRPGLDCVWDEEFPQHVRHWETGLPAVLFAVSPPFDARGSSVKLLVQHIAAGYSTGVAICDLESLAGGWRVARCRDTRRP